MMLPVPLLAEFKKNIKFNLLQFNYSDTLTAFSCFMYFFYWLKDFKTTKYAIFDFKYLSHLTLLFATISLSLYYSNRNAHCVIVFVLQFT